MSNTGVPTRDDKIMHLFQVIILEPLVFHGQLHIAFCLCEWSSIAHNRRAHERLKHRILFLDHVINDVH